MNDSLSAVKCLLGLRKIAKRVVLLMDVGRALTGIGPEVISNG
jgi:hypothetical protein